MPDQFPDEWLVTVERDSETHDQLCDVVLNDAGYTFVNDRLYEIITWVPVGVSSWRWTLRRCDNVGSA
jgi:hypothetical protein